MTENYNSTINKSKHLTFVAVIIFSKQHIEFGALTEVLKDELLQYIRGGKQYSQLSSTKIICGIDCKLFEPLID